MSESENKKPRVLRRSHGKLQPEIKPMVLEYKERRKKSAAETDEIDGLAHEARIPRIAGEIGKIGGELLGHLTSHDSPGALDGVLALGFEAIGQIPLGLEAAAAPAEGQAQEDSRREEEEEAEEGGKDGQILWIHRT